MVGNYRSLDDDSLERLKEFYMRAAENPRPSTWQRVVRFAYAVLCIVAWLAFLGSLSTTFLDGIRNMTDREVWILLISGAVAITVAVLGWRNEQNSLHIKREAAALVQESNRRFSERRG